MWRYSIQSSVLASPRGNGHLSIRWIVNIAAHYTVSQHMKVKSTRRPI